MVIAGIDPSTVMDTDLKAGTEGKDLVEIKGLVEIKEGSVDRVGCLK